MNSSDWLALSELSNFSHHSPYLRLFARLQRRYVQILHGDVLLESSPLSSAREEWRAMRKGPNMLFIVTKQVKRWRHVHALHTQPYRTPASCTGLYGHANFSWFLCRLFFLVFCRVHARAVNAHWFRSRTRERAASFAFASFAGRTAKEGRAQQKTTTTPPQRPNSAPDTCPAISPSTTPIGKVTLASREPRTLINCRPAKFRCETSDGQRSSTEPNGPQVTISRDVFIVANDSPFFLLFYKHDAGCIGRDVAHESIPDLVLSCLMDPSFAGFVEAVERSLKSLTTSCPDDDPRSQDMF